VVPVKGCNVRRQTDLGGQPLAGVNDSGCNTVTFRITGGGFVSSNLDMLFGTSQARPPFLAYPYSLNGNQRVTGQVCLPGASERHHPANQNMGAGGPFFHAKNT